MNTENSLECRQYREAWIGEKGTDTVQRNIICSRFSNVTILSLVTPIFQQSLSMMDVAILLGYAGIAVSVVRLVRKNLSARPIFQPPKRLSSMERETLYRTKKYLRIIGLSVIVLCILAYAGIWYIERDLPFRYIHILILAIACLCVSYLNVLNEEKKSSFPSISELSQDHRRFKYPRNILIIQCVNAAILLVFCVLYVRSRSAPFHGIWGVIAWAGTLFLAYSPAAIAQELFGKEKKINYALTIPLSWVLVIFWIGLGVEMGSETTLLRDLGGALLVIFMLGYYSYYLYRKIQRKGTS